MIDVVYKLGEKCEWGEFEELRYSLRSVEQNFKDLGKVYIVGYRPRWLQNIIHIPAMDPYKTNKDGNLINKMVLAAAHPDITDYFINISDDQYIMKPVIGAEFKHPLIDNSHITFVPGQRLNRWQERLKRSIDELKKRGLKFDCYEAHVPYLLCKHDYIGTVMQYPYGFETGMCGNTLYFNTIRAQGRMKTSKDLVRIKSDWDYNKMLLEINKVRFLNHTSAALTDDLKRILKEKFPNPSKFEMF